MDHANVTTALEFPGKKIVKNIGLARSITIRSPSVFGSIGTGLQTILGGNVTLYTKLCEKAREEAYEAMIKYAEELSAKAIIAVLYNANELGGGIAKVLCYGTPWWSKKRKTR